MTTITRTHPLRSLADRTNLEGTIILPGEAGWDAARQAWNLAVDQHPAAVAFPETTDDVVSIVRLAAATGAAIVTQGTGHGAATYASLDDTILVRTTRMQGVRISGDVARVQAGSLWGDVAIAAAAHGVTGLGGSSPDVGVVGYTLGGGIGWLSRRHGLASNSVRSIDLITADGVVRRVDHEHDPDLFWALRGGGGGLGLVTAIEFDLFPIDTVFAGTLAWDAIHAPTLFGAWSEWTSGLDRSITSIMRFLNLPDVPGVPEPFRGRRVVTLGAAAVGDFAIADRVIGQVRRVATPILDTFGPLPASALCRLHGDPEGPTAGMAHHALLSSLDEDTVQHLVGLVGPESGSSLISVEVRHLGGALSQPPQGAGALSHLDAPFVLNAVGMAGTADQAAATEEELTHVVEGMNRWSAGTYLNFAERPGPSPFDPETDRRLTDIKAQFDPDGRFPTRSTLATQYDRR